MKIATIKAAIAAEREDARCEAAALNPGKFIQSRGTHIAVSAADGSQSSFMPEAEAIKFKKTMTDVNSVIEALQRMNDPVTKDGVYIAGGFDSADSPNAWREGDYEPWASEWSVELWSMTKGWLLPEFPENMPVPAFADNPVPAMRAFLAGWDAALTLKGVDLSAGGKVIGQPNPYYRKSNRAAAFDAGFRLCWSNEALPEWVGFVKEFLAK